MRKIALAALPLLLANLAACSDPADDGGTTEQFAVTLDAGQVVGAQIASPATGTATLSYDGAVLSYTIDVEAITNVTMAHIHGPAGAGDNAAIRLWLFSPSEPTGPVSGRLVSGAVGPGSPGLEGVTLDRVLEFMRADSAYILVHTSEHPDGEIRGHVTR